MPAQRVHRRIVGVPSLGVLILCYGGALAAVVFCWAFVAAPADDYRDVLSVAGACGLALPLLLLGGTSRVRVDTTGVITVVSLLVDGWGRWRSATPSSGRSPGQRRSRRDARRVDGFLSSDGWEAPPGWRQDAVRARVRLVGVLVTLATSVTLIGSTLLINGLWRGAL